MTAQVTKHTRPASSLNPVTSKLCVCVCVCGVGGGSGQQVIRSNKYTMFMNLGSVTQFYSHVNSLHRGAGSSPYGCLCIWWIPLPSLWPNPFPLQLTFGCTVKWILFGTGSTITLENRWLNLPLPKKLNISVLPPSQQCRLYHDNWTPSHPCMLCQGNWTPIHLCRLWQGNWTPTHACRLCQSN